MLKLTTALRKAGTAALMAEDLGGGLPFSGNQLDRLTAVSLDSVIFRASVLYNPKSQGNHSIPIDPATGPQSPRPAYFYEEG